MARKGIHFEIDTPCQYAINVFAGDGVLPKSNTYLALVDAIDEVLGSASMATYQHTWIVFSNGDAVAVDARDYEGELEAYNRQASRDAAIDLWIDQELEEMAFA